MNRLSSLLSFLAILATSGVAVASAQPNIVTVHVANAAERYYKVQDFLEEVRASQEQAQGKVEAMNEEGKVLEQELNELREQALSDILTEEARMEATEDAKVKYNEIMQKKNEIQQFLNNLQRSLQARERTQMTLFTKDIQDVIMEIQAERKATLVLDISGQSRNGMPTVIYSDTSYDITEEVIKRINATKSAAAPAE